MDRHAQQRAVRLYGLLWKLITPLVHLILYLRVVCGKEDLARLSERRGLKWQKTRPDGRLVWLHAVSVGESVAARTLAEALLSLRKNVTVLITTNTVTAAGEIAKTAEKWHGRCLHSYQPLDHKKWVGRFLDYWRPDCAVFLESDFWPMLITETHARDIPVLFASAQLSQRSFKIWQHRKSLAAALFGCARRIYCVDDEQHAIFASLRSDISSDTIITHGSLKVSVSSLVADETYGDMLKQAAAGRPILVCASTHDAEEELLVEALARCSVDGFSVYCVMAPRHPIRADAVAALIPQVRRRSHSDVPSAETDYYLNDTLGEMGSLFAAADLVFLGGSLVPLGGHNPLEPALFGVPLLSGPFIEKNKSEFAALEALGTATIMPPLTDHNSMITSLTQTMQRALQALPLSNKQKQASQKYAQNACSRADLIADYICTHFL